MTMDALETAREADRRPDMDIRADAQEAILTVGTANSTGVQVAVSVLRGQVTLTGYMRSEMIGAGIEHAVRAVAGASSVVNHLVDDSSLVRRLATALATDARTRDIAPGYQVSSAFGRVMVVGAFSSKARAAVSQVGSSVAGVRSVEIRSNGNPPQAQN
jgi:osmotically-inducible protein OsmY